MNVSMHELMVWAVLLAAPVTLLFLWFRPAPYGRHSSRPLPGPTLSNRTGWVVMELPAVAVFLLVYLQGDSAARMAPLIFLAMWQIHYVNRTFVFPFRTRTEDKRIAVAVVASGVLFNSANAYINARYISHLGEYDPQWLSDPRFLAGAAIFFCGMTLNLHSDHVLLNLRQPGDSGYTIPNRGAFRLVSSPNYLGEMIEWAGWALATWSLAGLAFCVFTIANLLPRAHANHQWYKERFPDYPTDRRALIPGIF